jgi:hypothetical protein
MLSEARLHRRVPLGAAIEIAVGPTAAHLEAVGRDISLGGLFAEVAVEAGVDPSRALAPGNPVFVYVTLPGEVHEMKLRGSVRWTCKGGLGIQFTHLADRHAHEIANFIRARA